MARPSKSVATLSKHLTKEEKRLRIEAENKLKGKADKLQPPAHLSKSQKNLFKYIIAELEAAGILGNLDLYILETCVIAIDMKRQIDELINENINNAFDSKILAAKKRYADEFFRCCNELSLSPQARAKLGNINIEKQKEEGDPLLQILQGGRNG